METMRAFESHADAWGTVELVINVWFLLEFAIRLVCSPSVSVFLHDCMNVVDFFVILPYFLILLVGSSTLGNLVQMLRALKFIRVCRCDWRNTLHHYFKNSIKNKQNRFNTSKTGAQIDNQKYGFLIRKIIKMGISLSNALWWPVTLPTINFIWLLWAYCILWLLCL